MTLSVGQNWSAASDCGKIKKDKSVCEKGNGV